MEHRWVLIMSCNACGFSSSGCPAHRDTFAKAGTAHSIFDSFTSFTGCSYVVYRSFIGASCIQLLRWKHKIWKVLNSYSRYESFKDITTSSRLQPLHVFKGDQILVNEDIYGGMHRLLTQEHNTAQFILPKHSYLCHAWSMYYADLYHLVFFDVLYFQNIFSYIYVHYFPLLLPQLLAHVEDVEVCKVPLQDCQHNGVQAVPMCCTEPPAVSSSTPSRLR